MSISISDTKLPVRVGTIKNQPADTDDQSELEEIASLAKQRNNQKKKLRKKAKKTKMDEILPFDTQSIE